MVALPRIIVICLTRILPSNDELVQTGYAVKPIAGRCGSNIDLVSHQEELLDKTSGKFATQKNIYQQLWCLPKVAGKYIQVCTFNRGR
ncbi:glutathionylspermidine synthase [Salmonella bongori]|nr:glutathionylspermidine synthase [Salmonella bongori]